MKFNLLCTMFLLVFLSDAASASAISVTDSKSCKFMKGKETPFILVLKKGEKLNEGIRQCIEDANLPGASFSGIGAVGDTTLRYFNLSNQKYKNNNFNGEYEIVSLNGNIAELNGNLFAHIHMAIGDENGNVKGGHLLEATVSLVAEITITPLKQLPQRKQIDPNSEFNPIIIPSNS